jgi:hypothetical protein
VDDELTKAYRETSFWAGTPRGPLCVRIGVPNLVLDALLAGHGVCSWAYVTAWSPGSVRLNEEENVRRQYALEETLRQDGLTVFPGEGVGDDGRRPPEPSVLVLGISHADALALGQRFGQRAILYGEAGGSPQLLSCQEG